MSLSSKRIPSIVHRPSHSCHCFLVILVSSLLIVPTLCSVRPIRQTSNDITTTTLLSDLIEGNNSGDDEPLLDVSELKNVDLKQLLEISIVNKSVNHYHKKFHNAHASLQNRVKYMMDTVRQGSSRFQTSPEFSRKLNQTFAKFIRSLELSPYCLASLNHIRSEVMHKKIWPMKFIDSMELVPSGMFEGVLSSFGLFEECVTIESPLVKWNDIRGKYCLAKVHLPFLNPTFPEESDLELEAKGEIELDPSKMSDYGKKKALFEHFNVEFDALNNKLKLMQMINMFNGSYFRLGLCFPSSCTSFELERVINKFLEPFEIPVRIEIESQCTVSGQEVQFNNYQRFAFFVLAMLGLLVGASTCYEYYLTNMVNQPMRKNDYDSYLISFSAISNTKALFELESCDKRLSVIDTIVLLFVCLEFLGRSYVLPVFYGMMNIKRPLNGLPKEYFTAKKFFFIRGSSFAVCTYVLATAIVLSYKLCGHKKLSPVNYLKYVANRWLSYTRRLIGPILLIFLMPLFGDGPIWHYFEQIYTTPCKNNLISSFLFYSNFANSMDEVCNSPSVVLSALFGLSLLAPFILYSLKSKLFGSVTFIALVILGSIATILPKIAFDLPVAPFEIASMTSTAQAKLSFIHYYAGTDQLIVVFTCGLFIGYVIRCKPDINLGKKMTNFVLWGGMLLLPFLSTEWNETFKPIEGNFSQFSFISWFLLSKIMWSLGFGWIMFACCTGRSGPIKDLLTAPLIRPLSKLAFGVYMNHITILSYRQLTKKELSPLTHIEILTDDLADIVIAFSVSYFFYIMIERPFYHWIKIVVGVKEPASENYPDKYSRNSENGKLKDTNDIDLRPFNSNEPRPDNSYV